MTLSGEQRAAVERWGQDVCVVAGPGSGKTRVLIERFAWVVEARGCDPARILAVTFTEKAATEIKARLARRFAGQPERRRALERAWVGTIDGFCARLLREHAVAAGVDPRFVVLEQPRADRLAREAAEEALEGLFAERPREMRALLEAIDLAASDGGAQPDLARSLLELLGERRLGAARAAAGGESAVARLVELARRIAPLAAPGAEAERLREWARAFLAEPERRLALCADYQHNGNKLRGAAAFAGVHREAKDLVEAAAGELLAERNAPLVQLLGAALDRLEAAFTERKRAAGGLDFADLEELAVRLLEEHAEIREATRARFDHILMDELQDTNPLQWRLVGLLRREGSFFAVGDINQSIYGFRHAAPESFEEFRRAVAAAGVVDDLRDNHRSRAGVLAAVERVADGLDGIVARPLRACYPYRAQAEPAVEILVGEGDGEADLVAARLAELRGSLAVDDQGGERPAAYRDFAVLARTLKALEPFAEALERRGIPALLSGGRLLFEAREVRDLVLLLRVLANPRDEVAVAGVLRSPLVGLSDADIWRWKSGGGAGERLEEFFALVAEVRRRAVSPDRLLQPFLDASGYEAALGERGRANVEKFLGLLRRRHAAEPEALVELCDSLEALRAAQAEAPAPPPLAADAVRLMTVHAAKGLEFPCVFLAAMHRRPDPGAPPLLLDGQRIGVKWFDAESGRSFSDPVWRAVQAEVRAREVREENRLLYVAMTRARERLVLSWTVKKQKGEWVKRVEAALSDLPRRNAVGGAVASRGAAEPPPVVFLERAAATEQYDGAVAATSLALFAADPARYRATRHRGADPEVGFGAEDDVPDAPAGPDGSAFGREVHAALAETAAGVSPEARELAERFRESPLGRRAAAARRAEREFDFLFAVEDVVVRGQIDLWFDDGELVIVDYKTDRDRADAERYRMQLQIYAAALARYAGRPVDGAYLYWLREDAAEQVAVDPEAAERAVRAWRSAAG